VSRAHGRQEPMRVESPWVSRAHARQEPMGVKSLCASRAYAHQEPMRIKSLCASKAHARQAHARQGPVHVEGPMRAPHANARMRIPSHILNFGINLGRGYLSRHNSQFTCSPLFTPPFSRVIFSIGRIEY